MQIFFNLSRVGIDGNKWSKKKFNEVVTTYINSFEGVQIYDMFESTGWDSYTCLIDVNDKEEALHIRKEVERLCKLVSPKCEPYYFRFRNKDATISEINIMGLTSEEQKRFNDLAPAGVYRQIQV